MQKILIVEDDMFLQGLEAGKLQKSGYEIISARNGTEALTNVMQPGINLVLLDLMLPDVDGFEILENIKNNKALSHIPVIVFSNLSGEDDIKRAKKLGAVDYMVKSNFTLDELVEHIRMVLK